MRTRRIGGVMAVAVLFAGVGMVSAGVMRQDIEFEGRPARPTSGSTAGRPPPPGMVVPGRIAQLLAGRMTIGNNMMRYLPLSEGSHQRLQKIVMDFSAR